MSEIETAVMLQSRPLLNLDKGGAVSTESFCKRSSEAVAGSRDEDGLQWRASHAVVSCLVAVCCGSSPDGCRQLALGRPGGDKHRGTFVLDSYLQLQFDEAMLNVDVWPAVEYEGRVWRSGDLGYADSLRRLCGETVVETTEASGDGLRVRFNEGQIHINPSPDEVFVEIACCA